MNSSDAEKRSPSDLKIDWPARILTLAHRNCLELFWSTELFAAFLYPRKAHMRRIIFIGVCALLLAACSNNNNSHTTATTYIAPPPHQVLSVIHKQGSDARPSATVDPSADQKKPLLIFYLENGKTF